jgi:hypothetical protein
MHASCVPQRLLKCGAHTPYRSESGTQKFNQLSFKVSLVFLKFLFFISLSVLLFKYSSISLPNYLPTFLSLSPAQTCLWSNDNVINFSSLHPCHFLLAFLVYLNQYRRKAKRTKAKKANGVTDYQY